MALDIKALQEWIGKREFRSDQVTAAPIVALSATLDRDDPAPQSGDPLPPLWHWLYFLPVTRQSALGDDGHARRGGFLPPIPLPRRMWAGSRLQFHRALNIGEGISRTSVISDVSHKEGRSGSLVFVTVRHEIRNAEGIAIGEEQDVVYRENPKPGDPVTVPKSAPELPDWQRMICPDPVLLFRYSALTFNGHRIHYDRRYATEVEGYSGLVVHGPLIATLLLDLLRRNVPDKAVSRFSFRAVRALFDTAQFAVCGRMAGDKKSVELWAQDVDGWLAMEATATLL